MQPGAARRRPPLQAPAGLARHTLLQVPDRHQPGMPVEWAPWLQAVGLSDLERAAAVLTFSGYVAAGALTRPVARALERWLLDEAAAPA